MLMRRIIACLDVKDGRTVKGVNYLNLRDAGDPVDLARKYSIEGADEIVFLDITATNENRKTLHELVTRVAEQLDIPFTVGGGINSVDGARELLNRGADKISVNSAAAKDPSLVARLAKEFGSQCVVVAIDTKRVEGVDRVFIGAGTVATDWTTRELAKRVVEEGAGEILLTSMDHDGTKMGYESVVTKELALSLPIPVIASGGAGNIQHFKDVFLNTGADAALASSIFHFGDVSLPILKRELSLAGVPVRELK